MAFKVLNVYGGADGSTLYRTSHGFQLGKESDSDVVTSLSQVSEQPEYVKEMVSAWLDGGGAEHAIISVADSKIEAGVLSETSGEIDALASMLGTEFRAKLFTMLEKEVKKKRPNTGLLLARIAKSAALVKEDYADDEEEEREFVGVVSDPSNVKMEKIVNGSNIELVFN